VEPLCVRSEAAVVRDAFEIKPQFGLAHESGLVTVLDRVVSEPAFLAGKTAVIETPMGGSGRFKIDEAKDHIAATSLFFKNLTQKDIPVGSRVSIE
jgi:hypothetical protein